MCKQKYLLVLMFVAAAACEGGRPGDGADDSFLVGGKADMGGVSEGSGEACGVLRLASEAALDVLDVTVRLDKRAAANIVAYRAGADALAGTDDDERFDSLEELDAIKYVGPSAFAKMLAYAGANGFTCTDVTIQIDSLSDWHGQLDPVSVYGVGNVGGAAALATYFRNDRAANPNTLTLSAGDPYGASPPLAGFFEEKPVVEAMNMMKFTADAVGNHEFDRGPAHMQTVMDMAAFPFLSANIRGDSENLSCPSRPGGQCVRPYVVVPIGGIKVAVIGVSTPETPDLVKPGSMGTMEVTDPVEAANEARQEAAEEGAQVFVALAHIGAVPGATVTGPLVDFAGQLTGFDLVIGAHTHTEVNTTVNGIPVVETKTTGLQYARVALTYDFASHAVAGRTVSIVTPTADAVTADPGITALLQPYQAQLARIFDRPIGTADGVFERKDNSERLREIPIGDLLADALRVTYGVDLGFVNGGGIRAPLPSTYMPADHALRRPDAGYAAGPPYDLVVGDAYAVLPFGNNVVTRTVTGTQIWQMLEHSVEYLPVPKGSFAQISGIKFVFNSTQPAGSRVVSVTRGDGTPVPKDDTRYTMATLDFIDLGGDGYTMLANGDGVNRDKIADVLMAYIATLGTLTPSTDGRITDQATP